MNVDQVFGLPCPDDEDQAAVALYMQRLAQTVEAQLLDQRTRIRKAYRPQCAIWRSVNTSGPISNTGFSNFSIDSSGLLFSNYQIQYVPGSDFFFPPSIGQGNRTFNEPGLWTIGLAVRTSETGAVSGSTPRIINLALVQQTPNGEVIRARMDRQMVSTTSANEWCTVQGTFVVGDDVANWYMAQVFTHGNAASTMQITAGDLIMWALKITSEDQIEVA